MNTPPPEQTLPIIHTIRVLHKDLYNISGKLSKRDKLGIHSLIEAQIIKILSLAVEAAFKKLKLPTLEHLRVQIEILKHLIRTEHELSVIDQRAYIRLSEQLIEISKMTNGWIHYMTQKELR